MTNVSFSQMGLRARLDTSIWMGRGFKKSNLYLFVFFYQNHPDFFQLPIGKFPIRLSICTKNYKYGAKICFLL